MYLDEPPNARGISNGVLKDTLDVNRERDFGEALVHLKWSIERSTLPGLRVLPELAPHLKWSIESSGSFVPFMHISSLSMHLKWSIESRCLMDTSAKRNSTSYISNGVLKVIPAPNLAASAITASQMEY